MTLIAIDLDETLISSIPLRSPYRPEERLEESDFARFGIVTYLRPRAREMLAVCRAQRVKVVLLTAAERPYAEAINESFDLGFTKEHLICLPDFQGSLPRFGLPASVLLDDMSSQEVVLQTKLGVLGISSQRHMQVPSFAAKSFVPERFHPTNDRFIDGLSNWLTQASVTGS